ncbi:MAG TPA: SpoIID/LytB domain-containing protein [Actinomycetota bacterium]|nr:SpoIID/LytB domain-containing protein [Actinomycetota bacterium]
MSRLLASALAMALALAMTSPGAGAAPARRLGAAVAPVRLIPKGTAPLAVSGLHSYFGTIEIGAAADGLVISNRLPLERYLLGLAEVPLTWPDEALKAQAVAARTYALFTLRQPPGGSAAVYGFDICASVECQVYSGADVVGGVGGSRWTAAVDATAGQTVLYEGEPILARYHSTSGGRTLDNPQAFPDEGAYPYLRGVGSTTEQGSPLYRWTVDFPLRRLETLVRRAGIWSATYGRLLDVRSRPSSQGFHYPDVVFRGRKGDTVVTAEELRDEVRELAPRLFPEAYPSPWSTASGRLPETFPSNRIDVFTTRRVVRVVGRGWGHGVGMSQWGAHGLASRGAGHLDILGHYYTGVSVGDFPDPGPLEVGLDWGRSSVTVRGEFEVVDGLGRTLVKNALGDWRFDFGGEGAVAIDPPQGFGLPLRVGLVDAPRRVQVGETVYLTVALSRPAKVRTVTRAATAYDDPGVRIAAAGRRRIIWAAPLEEGNVEVHVEARSQAKRVRTEPVTIEVFSKPLAQGATPPPAEPERPETPRFPFLLVAAGAATLLLAGILVWARSGRKLEP